MTYRIEVTVTRPSQDVPFFSHHNPDLWQASLAVLAEHKLNGFLIDESRFVTEDKLQSHYMADWTSQEAYIDKNNHPTIVEMNAAREQYNNSVGITRVFSDSTF